MTEPRLYDIRLRTPHGEEVHGSSRAVILDLTPGPHLAEARNILNAHLRALAEADARMLGTTVAGYHLVVTDDDTGDTFRWYAS